LFKKWQQVEMVVAEHAVFGSWIIPNAGREMLMRVMILVGCHAELPLIVGAVGTPRSLAGCLNGRQQ
jgi:hypothetical protein